MEKNLELRKWFKDMNAVMEQWKFSIETTEEGTVSNYIRSPS